MKINEDKIIERLINRFDYYLETFAKKPPFRRLEQLKEHQKTIELRRELGSAIQAIENDGFLRQLYRTIRVWGIGSRRSRLKPFPEFAKEIVDSSKEISSLDGIRLNQKEINFDSVIFGALKVLQHLKIVDNITFLVPCTKTLHHILPDLIVPIDRAYTQMFFAWPNPRFQNGQEEFYQVAMKGFRRVAETIDIARYVGSGWNSSISKVIDNAIVGYIMDIKEELEKGKHS